MTQVHRTVRSAEPIGIDLLSIKPGTDIDVDVRLESVSEGVLVSGCVSGEATGQCSRCLGEIEQPVNVFLTQLFVYQDSVSDQTSDDDELFRVANDEIDLEQAIIDEIGDALPMSPLCRDECQGLCPECGLVLAETEPDHQHENIDPRWAALRSKFTDNALAENDSESKSE